MPLNEKGQTPILLSTAQKTINIHTLPIQKKRVSEQDSATQTREHEKL